MIGNNWAAADYVLEIGLVLSFSRFFRSHCIMCGGRATRRTPRRRGGVSACAQQNAVRYAVANYLWHPLLHFGLQCLKPPRARPGGHSQRDDGLVMGCWLSDTELEDLA